MIVDCKDEAAAIGADRKTGETEIRMPRIRGHQPDGVLSACIHWQHGPRRDRGHPKKTGALGGGIVTFRQDVRNAVGNRVMIYEILRLIADDRHADALGAFLMNAANNPLDLESGFAHGEKAANNKLA